MYANNGHIIKLVRNILRRSDSNLRLLTWPRLCISQLITQL